MIVKSVKVLALAVAMVACLLWATPADAQCTDSLAFGNIAGSYIEFCDDSKPIDGYATILGASGTTGQSNIICRTAADVPQGGSICQVAAGDATDGRITISGNWANPGSQGCPPSGNLGRNIYYIRDSQGNGLILSVGADPGVGTFEAGAAERQPTPTSPVTHLRCLPRGSRSITLLGAT